MKININKQKTIKIIFTSILLLLSIILHAQNSITGIYSSCFNQIEFNTNGTFTIINSFYSNGIPIHGKWEQINDSMFLVKCDTIIRLNPPNDHVSFDKMRYTLLFYKEWLLREERYILDDYQNNGISLKIACFYSDNKLKCDNTLFHGTDNFKITTNYFQDRKIHEIISYIGYPNRIKHGFYLSYNTDGRLERCEMWYKGKLKKLWEFMTGDILSYNAQSDGYPIDKVKKCSKNFNVITNYFPDGRIYEIISYVKGIKDGFYLRYNLNGRLDKYEVWDKGKIKTDRILWGLSGMYSK